MAIRKRGGKWHYQFQYQNVTYCGPCGGLEATRQNVNAARLYEMTQLKLVKGGQAHLLKLDSETFASAVDKFISWAQGEYREHPGTWKRLRGSLHGMQRAWGNLPISSLTAGLVEDYKSLRRVQEHVAEITLRHDLHALASLLRYARKHNWIAKDANPLDDVEIPSDAEAVRIHVVTSAEESTYKRGALALIGKWANQSGMIAARQTAAFQSIHDIARLMLLQGPRPSEVMSARAEDVRVERGEWRIPRGKSKAARRTLYLTPESIEIMARRLEAAGPSGWLFHGRNHGTHMTDCQHAHEDVLAEAGLCFVLYDFRHTFATRMAEAGCDIATLAGILGHSNLRTVQRYIHISEEHKRAAMQRYGASQDSARLLPDIIPGRTQIN